MFIFDFASSVFQSHAISAGDRFGDIKPIDNFNSIFFAFQIILERATFTFTTRIRIELKVIAHIYLGMYVCIWSAYCLSVATLCRRQYCSSQRMRSLKFSFNEAETFFRIRWNGEYNKIECFADGKMCLSCVTKWRQINFSWNINQNYTKIHLSRVSNVRKQKKKQQQKSNNTLFIRYSKLISNNNRIFLEMTNKKLISNVKITLGNWPEK